VVYLLTNLRLRSVESQTTQRRISDYAASNLRLRNVESQTTQRRISDYAASNFRLRSVESQITQRRILDYAASNLRLRNVESQTTQRRISDYAGWNGGIIAENWTNLDGNCCSLFKVPSRHVDEGTEENRNKTSASIAGIRTEDLPNTNLERY
jgi:hypothetical protein